MYADQARREIESLAAELRNPNLPLARIEAIEAQITAKAASIERVAAQRRTNGKAAAILAGVPTGEDLSGLGDHYAGEPFLAHVKAARMGDPQSNEYVKAVLGTSDATGQAIVPNAFVAELVEQVGTRNPFRQLMTVNAGIRSNAVDIPYNSAAISAALVQGAYGSNKDIRDYSFGLATATLYTIAQIADISNQLLRQSGGVAEANARRRLAESFGMAESNFIINGTGSGQPLGILQAILAYGDPLSGRYALNSESRVAALAGGIAKLDARGIAPNAIVMNPTDVWTMLRETLGTSGAGGWAIDPAAGPSAGQPTTSLWGLPVVKCAELASGTALVAEWSAFDIFLGNDFRIDVSSEAGNRFDQNITGFRAEEDFAFNAEPGVRTGKVVKVTGIA
jgi:HK97 family phage major capsid protein